MTIIIGILVCTYIAAKVLRGILDRALKKPSKIINVDTTQLSFMKHFISGLIHIIGMGIAVYIIPELKDLSVLYSQERGFLRSYWFCVPAGFFQHRIRDIHIHIRASACGRHSKDTPATENILSYLLFECLYHWFNVHRNFLYVRFLFQEACFNFMSDVMAFFHRHLRRYLYVNVHKQFAASLPYA